MFGPSPSDFDRADPEEMWLVDDAYLARLIPHRYQEVPRHRLLDGKNPRENAWLYTCHQGRVIHLVQGICRHCAATINSSALTYLQIPQRVKLPQRLLNGSHYQRLGVCGVSQLPCSVLPRGLHTLDLRWTCFHELPRCIGESRLRSLLISHCGQQSDAAWRGTGWGGLYGEGHQQAIERLKGCSERRLGDWLHSAEAETALPPTLCNLQISGTTLGAVPRCVRGLPALQTLSLNLQWSRTRHGARPEHRPRQLPEFLATLPALRNLALEGVDLHDCLILRTMPLQRLSLTNVDSEVFAGRPSHKSNCAALRTLFSGTPLSRSIRELNLSGHSLEALPSCLRGVSHLQSLVLSSFDLVELPEWLGELPLRYLSLMYSKVINFPQSLCGMQDLRLLDLTFTDAFDPHDALDIRVGSTLPELVARVQQALGALSQALPELRFLLSLEWQSPTWDGTWPVSDFTSILQAENAVRMPASPSYAHPTSAVNP